MNLSAQHNKKYKPFFFLDSRRSPTLAQREGGDKQLQRELFIFGLLVQQFLGLALIVFDRCVVSPPAFRYAPSNIYRSSASIVALGNLNNERDFPRTPIQIRTVQRHTRNHSDFRVSTVVLEVCKGQLRGYTEVQGLSECNSKHPFLHHAWISS